MIPRGLRIRPVEAAQAWLEAAAITEGLLFPAVRSAQGRQGEVAGPTRHRCGAGREAIRQGGGPRCGGVQRAQPTRWLRHQRGRDRSKHSQNSGGLAAQVGRCAQRLRAARRSAARPVIVCRNEHRRLQGHSRSGPPTFVRQRASRIGRGLKRGYPPKDRWIVCRSSTRT